MKQGEKVTENIWLCPDGVYRWSYELDMLRNPTIFITVCKVLGIAFGVVYLLDVAAALLGHYLGGWSGLWVTTRNFLLLFAFMLLLAVIAYLIIAAIYGWKYMVLFEMDEKTVKHIQMPKQFKKAEALGWITALAGLAAHSHAAAGAGLLAASKSSSTSEFANVERVIVQKRRHVIKVDQLFSKNQIYAADADFDFVSAYITERCVKARIRK